MFSGITEYCDKNSKKITFQSSGNLSMIFDPDKKIINNREVLIENTIFKAFDQSDEINGIERTSYIINILIHLDALFKTDLFSDLSVEQIFEEKTVFDSIEKLNKILNGVKFKLLETDKKENSKILQMSVAPIKEISEIIEFSDKEKEQMKFEIRIEKHTHTYLKYVDNADSSQ